MIFGIGVDIIEVSRLDKEAKISDNFFSRVFTEKEIEYCESKKFSAQHYAGRFAAKEAFFKALGTGLRDGLTWKDVELTNDELGKPSLCFSGRAKEIIKEKNIKNAQVSLSHIKKLAKAFVILET
ncbi:MAG: holo-ACP synthase [Pseudomonadota bacterium]